MSDFSTPLHPAPQLYGGQADASARNPPNTVVIDGRIYAISLENYSNTALPAFRQGVVTSGEPSDQIFNPDGGWWRYRFDWSSGAGQNVADFGENRIGNKFRTSSNIDVWTENKLQLGPKVTQIFDSGGTHTAAVSVYTFDDVMYVCTGNTLYEGTDFTFTSKCTFGTPVHTLTFDGTYIYGISDSVIYQVNIATDAVLSSTITATNTFDNIAYVSNVLLFSDGNLLRQLNSFNTNSASTIFTHYDKTFEWTTFIGAGSSIFVGGYGGTKSQLYSLEATTYGLTPTIGAEATTFTGNERLFGGFEYGSIVVLQTSKGIRIGSINDNQVTYGPLVPSENPVFASVGEGQYVWYGATRDDNQIEIIRADLDNFTDVLKPAYASEIIDSNTDGKAVVSIVRYAEPTTFTPAVGEYQRYETTYICYSTLEGKVYKVGGGYAISGTLSTGDIYFGTAEHKSLGRVQVGFEPLNSATNETITVQLVNKETGVQLGQVIAQQDEQIDIELPATGYQFSSIELNMTLTSDGTTTPVIKQWKVNAYPVAPPIQRWRVPVMLYGTVVFGDGQGQHLLMNPHEELEHIRNLWQNRTVFLYREGIHQYRVRLDTFTVQPTRWDEDGDWLEAVVFVEMLSV